MKQKFSIPRTKEGILFELAFTVLVIIVWAIIIVMLRHSQEIIPIHFDLKGTPDSYGNKLTILFPCILTTVIGLCMLAGAYFPHTVNLPIQIKNMSQTLLVVRMMRVLAIIFLVLTLSLAYGILHQPVTVVPVLVCVGAMLVVIALFTFLVYSKR